MKFGNYILQFPKNKKITSNQNEKSSKSLPNYIQFI